MRLASFVISIALLLSCWRSLYGHIHNPFRNRTVLKISLLAAVTINARAFTFHCTGYCADIFPQAFARNTEGAISNVTVYANSLTPLDYGMDESYKLTVTNNSVNIWANTAWGALRGIETLAQLIVWDLDTEVYSIPCAPLSISDFPRFSWRGISQGLLVDTSRHFIPTHILLKMLDALEASKMNVFHWHIVDDDSFAVESKLYPSLAELGAWNRRAHYSYENMTLIVREAYLRGIRVVPEFDIPGHCHAWLEAYPSLKANCPSYAPIMNPFNESTYEFLKNFFGEMLQIFPDKYFHIGGDEVYFFGLNQCLAHNPDVQPWLQANNLTSVYDVQNYFEWRVQDLFKPTAFNRSILIWEETFDHATGNFRLDPEITIFHVATSPEALLAVVNAGYRTVNNMFCYYLDLEDPDGSYPAFTLTDSWMEMYAKDPLVNAVWTPEQLKLMMGGESSIWTESVDYTDILSNTFPRAGAYAERLWSPANLNDPNVATPRFIDYRCHLMRRGIPAAGVNMDYCEIGLMWVN